VPLTRAHRLRCGWLALEFPWPLPGAILGPPLAVVAFVAGGGPAGSWRCSGAGGRSSPPVIVSKVMAALASALITVKAIQVFSRPNGFSGRCLNRTWEVLRKKRDAVPESSFRRYFMNQHAATGESAWL
jgi:hypothetical protein